MSCRSHPTASLLCRSRFLFVTGCTRISASPPKSMPLSRRPSIVYSDKAIAVGIKDQRKLSLSSIGKVRRCDLLSCGNSDLEKISWARMPNGCPVGLNASVLCMTRPSTSPPWLVLPMVPSPSVCLWVLKFKKAESWMPRTSFSPVHAARRSNTANH